MSVRSNDLLELSIFELSKFIKNKKVSPVDVIQEVIKIIDDKNEKFNSFITVTLEKAIDDAKKAEDEIMKGYYKGPLHGVPLGLKDNVFTKGVKTTLGSQVYKDFIPDYDAEVVRKLKASGAVIVGKQNMQEFAYGTTGDRSFYGPVRNPHNFKKIAGGSSSGSAASVAGSIVFGSIGSDTGGSIRIPASCCGIVGMKPTFGRVSKYGVFPLSPTLDHLGPMTRCVQDNAILLNIISGYDKKDPYSVTSKSEDFTSEIGKTIRGLTIGVPTTFFFDVIQTEVQKIFDSNLNFLKKQGANIKYVHLDMMDELFTAQQVIATADTYVSLEKEVRKHPEKIDSEVRTRIVSGMVININDYMRALKMKHAAIELFYKTLKEVDVLMTPTLCALPTNIEQREVDFNGIKEHPRILGRLTGIANVLGFPAISVPGGYATDGTPVGIQFMGLPFSEKKLYQYAYFIETANT